MLPAALAVERPGNVCHVRASYELRDGIAPYHAWRRGVVLSPFLLILGRFFFSFSPRVAVFMFCVQCVGKRRKSFFRNEEDRQPVVAPSVKCAPWGSAHVLSRSTFQSYGTFLQRDRAIAARSS